jgi:ferredoxin-NADP reductase
MYWVKTQADAAYAEYFKETAENFPFQLSNFLYPRTRSTFEQKDVDQISALNETTVYACGPSL